MKARRWLWRSAWAPVLLLAMPALAGAAAQSAVQLALGDSVRFTAPSLGLHEAIGVFVSARSDSVVVRDVSHDTTTRVIAFSAITSFAVNHGNQPPRRMTAEGAFLGGLVGLTAGAIATVECPGIWNSCHSNPQVAFAGLAVGAVAGAFVGTVVKVTRYRTVALTPGMTATFDVKRRSVGLKLTIRM